MKAIKRSHWIVTLITLLTLFFFSFKISEDDRYFQIAKNLEIFTSVYNEVNKYYVDEVDPSELMEKGITSMLASLDPYTNYIAEDDIEDFRFISTGQYGGIGAVIGNRNGKIIIIMPYEGFPAHKAGLKIGDVISEIDGVKVTGKNSGDISQMLKGQADTKVNITIERFGEASPLKLELNREKITVKNVPYFGMVNTEIGYFKLSSFTTDATKDIQEAITELKKLGAKKFIFDLRGNTGGLLKEAIDISNLFIDKGNEIVSTRGKSKKWTTSYSATSNAMEKDAQLVVLVDNNSASASEIVSGVIQDYDRGVLIGQRTFGKGLVQATMPTVFNSQVKITTAKYYIPSGRCIQAINYSDKDKSGKAHKIPDSLLTAFKTKSGRLVYDGAGIDPDIKTKDEEMPEIIETLLVKNYIFDFVTEYVSKRPSIPSPKEYNLSDETYNQFLAWLKTKDFQYELSIEKKIKQIETEINEDSLHHLELDKELKAVFLKLSEYKKNDLITYKSEVKNLIRADIISRYYFEKGIIESSFSDDKDILEAVNVLSNENRYKELLTVKK